MAKSPARAKQLATPKPQGGSIRMTTQETRIERERLQLAADIEHHNALTELHKNAHRGTFLSDYLGQVMGFIVAMACVAGAIYAGAFLDRPWVAAILVSVPTIGIINAVRGMNGNGKVR